MLGANFTIGSLPSTEEIGARESFEICRPLRRNTYARLNPKGLALELLFLKRIQAIV